MARLQQRFQFVGTFARRSMNISKQYTCRKVTGRRNSPLLPQNIRELVIGKSGCRKTTVIFNILLHPDWLDYNHLYVFGKSLHQTEYKVFKKGFEGGLTKSQISNVFTHQIPPEELDQYSGVRSGTIKADFYDDCSAIPDPSDLDPSQNNLLLLDDCFLGKQNKAEAYYTRGIHNNYGTLYIAQNYFRLLRHTIRENSNFIILFRQDDKNSAHIHADHCADDMTLQEFKQFCHNVWKHDHNFVTIDLTSPLLKGK